MTGAPHFGESLLATAYLPPVSYFFAIAHSDRVWIEQFENYQKQSWRNRCRILSAAGPEDLSIPVVREERRSRPIRDIRIDYTEPWLQHHIRALAAAYNASAYYDYYADDLIPILESKPVFLFDLNMTLLEKLLELLDIQVPVGLTTSFVKDGGGLASARSDLFDGRVRIQPKYKGKSLLAEFGCEQAYYQVFVNREPSSGFIPDLSVIDLLSAEGPDAGRFLC
ncbi:MAG: WbqC family protein [Bacteroidales bacterium]|nr:WbqC family protein [Bacteroidales bacterium]